MITFRLQRPTEYTRECWLHALQAILPSAQEYTGRLPPVPHGTGSLEYRDHWGDPDHAIWVIVGRRICRADWRCESPESVAGALLSPDTDCFPA